MELLEDTVDPMLTEVIENGYTYFKDQLIFQRDGASVHYTRPIRLYLDQYFPGHRWIGRRGIYDHQIFLHCIFFTNTKRSRDLRIGFVQFSVVFV